MMQQHHTSETNKKKEVCFYNESAPEMQRHLI